MSDLPPPLETRWLGRAWRHLDACGSTNDEAAAWARAGAAAGAVVTAEEQTRGRGRLGRAWHSPPGASLYFSTVLRPSIAPAEVVPVTLAAGVALADAIAQLGGVPALKWPNDVLSGGKKVAGILTEMASRGGRIEHVIVGIGVNLRGDAFPEELRGIAGHVEAPRAALAAALCLSLEQWYERFLDRGVATVVDGWKRYAGFFGRRVTVSAGVEKLTGVAEYFAPDGALLLRSDDGRLHRLQAGEVAPCD